MQAKWPLLNVLQSSSYLDPQATMFKNKPQNTGENVYYSDLKPSFLRLLFYSFSSVLLCVLHYPFKKHRVYLQVDGGVTQKDAIWKYNTFWKVI